MKKLSALLMAALMVGAVMTTGCGKDDETQSSSSSSTQSTEGGNASVETLPQFKDPKAGSEIAVIKTNMGEIKVMFFPEQAPKAVENFITHAKNGYYNGLTFHRVINDFMIQGGDPSGNGTGGTSIWNEPFEDEFSLELHNFRGALSMANSGANTNGSQFFIVQGSAVDESLVSQMKQSPNFTDNVIAQYEDVGGFPQLDYRHTVFGQVIEGMDVVDAIAAVDTDENDAPKESVLIESITIETVS